MDGPRSVRFPSTLRRDLAAFVTLAAVAVAAGCSDATGPGDDGGSGFGLVELSVGESQVIRGGDGRTMSFELPGPDDQGAEYRLAVQSAAEEAGATAMRLSVESSGPQASSSGSSSVRPSRGGPDGGWALRDRPVDPGGLLARTRLQERDRRMLARRGVRPARPGPDGTDDPSFRTSVAPLTEGETVTLSFPVFKEDDGSLGATCDPDSAEEVVAEVRAVGERAAMLEDTATSTLGSANMDYGALAQEFDELVFGVDVAYFGEPTDIDGNGHVLVLFSPKVNDLTDPSSDGTVAGFFLSLDLADNGDATGSGTARDGTCRAGNEAELLYLLAPDPEAEHNAGQVSAEQAQRSARATSSHEFQHLLNAANRVIKQSGGFGDLEDTWMGEALSHVAEEVVGLAQEEETLRSNLTAADVREDQAEEQTFETFHRNNFLRLARYLEEPASTQALLTSDPGGAESLKMRGFVWLFARWLGDQSAAGSTGQVPGSGDPERQLFRQLAKADGQGLVTGVENVEEATGQEWPVLLGEFGAVPAVDDDVASLAGEHELLTWNLRQVFQDYPLAFESGGFGSGTFEFSVEAGTQKHVYLASDGAASGVTVELTDQTGEPLSAGSPQVTVVRTR